MICGVKYCGGCNPRFDRTGFFEAVKMACPDIEFQYVQPGITYERLLVICGCPSRCADITKILVSGKTFIISEAERLGKLTEELNQ